MSDTVTIALIAAIPTTLSSVAAIIIAFHALRKQLHDYHISVNGKMDKLLEVTGSEANLKGRSDLRLEQNAAAANVEAIKNSHLPRID